MMTANLHPPKISVCLLVYNHRHLLESTIESILNQTFTDFELIVSDDCSNDGSWELIGELAKRDSRIKPVRMESNQGMAQNANYAVKHARAPYIALLHHDDLCRADMLDKWLELMEQYPNAGFIANAYGVFNCKHVDSVDVDEYISGKYFLVNYLFRSCWGCPVRGTAMIRRSCWNDLNGMRLRFGMLADIDLWIRLASKWDVGYVKEPIIEVRKERPDDYPDEYSEWSWKRRAILIRIHGVNRQEYYTGRPVKKMFVLFVFRVRVTLNNMLWLCYAGCKKRRDMIYSSIEGKTEFELWPVQWLRYLLRMIYRKPGQS